MPTVKTNITLCARQQAKQMGHDMRPARNGQSRCRICELPMTWCGGRWEGAALETRCCEAKEG